MSRAQCSQRFAFLLAPLLLVVAPLLANAAEFPVSYDTAERSGLQPKLRAKHAPFPQRPTITGSNAGLVGDGRTDNTEAFRALFEKPGQNVAIGPGDFRTGKFVILGETVVTLAPGTTIRDTGQLGPNEPLIQIYGDHVKIVGNGAKVVEDRADYTSAEGRHGVAIGKVSDVTIEGLEASDTGGDGFYIGGPPNKPATDISLVNCVARNNRRNGLSIVNGRHIDVINSTFAETKGTLPMFGVDLEPNRTADVLDGILLYGVRTTDNQAGGILIWLDQLNSTSTRVDVEIVDHSSANEPKPLLTSTAKQSVAGVVHYVRVR
jgi:Right handed beta helix region